MRPNLVQTNNLMEIIDSSCKKKINLNYFVIMILLFLCLLLNNRYKSKKNHNSN